MKNKTEPKSLCKDFNSLANFGPSPAACKGQLMIHMMMFSVAGTRPMWKGFPYTKGTYAPDLPLV